MTPSDLFHAGRLREATDAQVQKVKSSPADRSARFFLFELFLFQRDLDRARKQLDVLRYDDTEHSAAIDQYRNALEAEAKRRAVFAGNEQPKGLAAAPDHVRLRLEALPYLARGEHAEARRRLDEANALVPAVTGTLNGLPIHGLYDADERLGTVLEVFGTGGVYSWVPLEQVASITLNPPKNPRDVVLRPASVVLHDGVEGDVLLPGLYPGTHEHPDDEVRLGRATEWVGGEGEVARGAGGRLFLAGENPVEFVKWRALATEKPAAAEPPVP